MKPTKSLIRVFHVVGAQSFVSDRVWIRQIAMAITELREVFKLTRNALLPFPSLHSVANTLVAESDPCG